MIIFCLVLFVLWDLKSIDMSYNLGIQEDRKQLISFQQLFYFLLLKYLSKAVSGLINISLDPRPTPVEKEMITPSQS